MIQVHETIVQLSDSSGVKTTAGFLERRAPFIFKQLVDEQPDGPSNQPSEKIADERVAENAVLNAVDVK